MDGTNLIMKNRLGSTRNIVILRNTWS
jgi:hypothetical protein